MWKDRIRRLMDNSGLVQRRRGRSALQQIEEWRAIGRPLPVPHAVKSQRIREIAQKFGCNVLVETGTCLGDMIHAVRDAFGAIHTIELSPYYAARSRERLGWLPHLTIHEGDSAQVLPQIVPRLKTRTLFWLDAHYSGGATAVGAEYSPIAHELATIAGRTDCILIDDARDFIGEHGYPTIEQLRQMCAKLFPQHSFRVADNIIEVLPQLGTSTPV